MAEQNFPASWGEVEVLDGLDVTDKSKLLGVTFRVIGVEFHLNDKNINIAYVDVETIEGEKFTITDSSTGIHAQIRAHLTMKEKDYAIESGEYVTLNLAVPNGLRVSEYPVAVRLPNGQPHPTQKQMAKTYYLTTSGKRPGAPEAVTEAKPKTSRTRGQVA